MTRRDINLLFFVLSAGLFFLLSTFTTAFEWSSAGSRPEVNRRAIAGIWKLTPTAANRLPMKEFTVYPKKKPKESESDTPELLLNLKEDGSFQQCASEDEEGDDHDVDSSWRDFQKKEREWSDFIKGTWDFLDGHLILAADRPDEESYSTRADGQASSSLSSSTSSSTTQVKTDTLLKGRVVASYQTRLEDNPVLADTNEADRQERQQQNSTTTALDTHLSVPNGSIKIGKFFYPKNHPSFWEQPMFRPKKKGTFALRQILGTLNTAQDDEEIVEKFQRSDFYNKTFLLTSHPIVPKQPKGNMRWSIKYNRFVHDPPSKKAAAAAEEAKQRAANIRVMQVAFFPNNTFSTVAGLGEAAILRGKFDVIGTEKDHLWMQVIRFGFGRSVSGSVYSEGRMLSHEDAKAYWGSIKDVAKDDVVDDKNSNPDESDLKAKVEVASQKDDNSDKQPSSRLEVEGSVLDGWGLEPIPVARFIMRESSNELDALLQDEEEDDEEEDDEEAISEEIGKLDAGLGDDGIDFDWSSDDNDTFQ